ncbi:hypothetical protein TNCV_2210491 [Trichonephila clavipes]|nr:hypothetical protein TNCV_2210491 [Trichonephila clavipes]
MASLGLQSLPPTELGRVDEETAFPGGKPLLHDPTDGHMGNPDMTGNSQHTGTMIVLYQIQHSLLFVWCSYPFVFVSVRLR